MVSSELLSELFEFGLGELLVMHAPANAPPVLGQIVLDKGRMMLRDRRLLHNATTAQLGPCYDIGVVGAVCRESDQEWKSLSFVGPERCHLTQDLSSTRLNLMSASRNEFNESLLNFHGSVYRGFKLMLDNHFLPVVLMDETALTNGSRGLAVANLRMAGVSFDVLGEIHEVLNDLVGPHVSFDVQDLSLEAEDFEAMFARYKAS